MTTPSSTDQSSVTLKLLIDSKEKRVLFAEAGKDFADFLFTLLSLPVGTVIRLLSSNDMVGTIGKLYESFENLSVTYIQPTVNKDTLLKPNSPFGGSATLLSLTNDASTSKKIYLCTTNGTDRYSSSYCSSRHASDDVRATCPNCNRQISVEVPYVAPPAVKVEGSSSDQGGFVKGVVTYMIMDDLDVKPMSTISSITMLNKFNVKEVGALEEKTVSLGIEDGLKLLKASLESKTVLTDVFLGRERDISIDP
ncbi:hypothetical protein TIFTF001_026411 [Ficus carica]|uniref:DUF674 domain-containing protein n=1 Tax=Ficus carica TaxID=3494 RepID=A0AA88IY93_FICCA|nr:hypothetical protein TIFTF001_026411 [Ficus carica]